ncbi:MAG TPA: nucleotidyltransferase family protein [Thiothrix sp.]|nr:nucleotidyltransferase family protein [Thiothrix sp.]
MKAMILAAGHGKRMRPLTEHTPKPLLTVGGKPLIVWHLEKLKRAGFCEIVINIAWLGEQIPQALGDGSQWGVSIQYSDEQHEGALETAGGIIKALPLLGNEPFLVVNGDVWCDYVFPSSDHAPSIIAANDLAHLILVNNPPHHLQGDFMLHDTRLSDEPSDHPKYTFSGIAYYRPEFFAELPYGKQALAPLLRNAIRQNQLSGELFSGDWRDIGTPERLAVLDQQLIARN